MKAALLIAVLAVVASFAAHAQTARFLKGNLVIKDSGSQIKITNVADPKITPPDPPSVESVVKNHGHYFVLAITHEWSLGHPDANSQCGVGVESYVKWFDVANGQLAGSKAGKYESCLDDTSGEVVGWQGSKFTVTTEKGVQVNGKDMLQTVTYTFDSRHPDKGLKESDGAPHAFPIP